jgi:hypothetical protein
MAVCTQCGAMFTEEVMLKGWHTCDDADVPKAGLTDTIRRYLGV